MSNYTPEQTHNNINAICKKPWVVSINGHQFGFSNTYLDKCKVFSLVCKQDETPPLFNVIIYKKLHQQAESY